ncbi:hypothetical protein PF006_g3254 [Phytophthora fragariae]|uniref:Uncharacterized protein n=1 Tax=Phytophthora fragariae TaxID=53985 RepID=A0A6A3UPG4_9STRA|nr:hypothetical protein PF006_g3254 [Phytophthora fragariae]
MCYHISILGEFGASSTFDKIACGKRCFNSLGKAARAPSKLVKKRVLRHNDGPSPNVSSISVLIDWLTTGTNYTRYRGGDDQCGDSKNTLARENVQLIEEADITTTRNAKDITNKITTLEASFWAAEDWLNNTGQGCDNNEPSIRAAILARCSYYFDLRVIMRDRVSTRPQLLNTDGAARKDDTDDDDEHSSDVESKSSEECPPTVFALINFLHRRTCHSFSSHQSDGVKQVMFHMCLSLS